MVDKVVLHILLLENAKFHNVLSISPFSGHATPRPESREQTPMSAPGPGSSDVQSLVRADTGPPVSLARERQLQAVTLALPAVVSDSLLFT